MNLELDPTDYLPAYYLYNMCNRNTFQQPSSSNWRCSVFSHCLVMLFAFAVCSGGYYYYHNYYVLMLNEDDLADIAPFCPDHGSDIENLKAQVQSLKSQINVSKEETRKLLKAQAMDFKMAIDKALDVYDADKIRIFDYAASYAGGVVCSTPDTYPYYTNMTVTFMSFFRMEIFSNAEVILQPSTLPGSCFAFQGHSGRIRIKLAKKIKVKSVTVDHPSIEMLEDYQSAPKNFEIFGLASDLAQTGALLGSFTYDIKGRPYQTFDMDSDASAQNEYKFIEVKIASNYGHMEYTCLYRVRVHSRDTTAGKKKCENCCAKK